MWREMATEAASEREVEREKEKREELRLGSLSFFFPSSVRRGAERGEREIPSVFPSLLKPPVSAVAVATALALRVRPSLFPSRSHIHTRLVLSKHEQ